MADGAQPASEKLTDTQLLIVEARKISAALEKLAVCIERCGERAIREPAPAVQHGPRV